MSSNSPANGRRDRRRSTATASVAGASSVVSALRGRRGGLRRAAGAVDQHQAGEVPAPGRPEKSQVAYAVTTAPPSEWPPSTTLPCELPGGGDHAVEVADGDPPSPSPWRTRTCSGPSSATWLLTVASCEPAEVVVERGDGRDLVLLGPIERRLVLEQVLAALDRPHLPVRPRGDDPPSEREEVGARRPRSRARARARCGPWRSRPSARRPCRTSPGSPPTEARHPLHAQRARSGGGRRRDHRGYDREQREQRT